MSYKKVENKLNLNDLDDFDICENSTNKILCLKNEILKRTDKFNFLGISNSYVFLNSVLKKNIINSGECHSVSHLVGEKAYLYYRNFDNLLSLKINSMNDANCTAGFYHGVMIAYSKNNSKKQYIKEMNILSKIYLNKLNLAKNLNEKEEFQQYIHGIGHANHASSIDVNSALELCKKINDEQYFVDICSSGVFMEESFNLMDYSYDFDISYCDFYDPKYIVGCLGGVRNSKQYLEKNFERYFNKCNQYSDRTQRVCLSNLALQLSYHDIDITNKKFCNIFNGEGKYYCIYSISFFYGNNFKDYRLANKIYSQKLCLDINLYKYYKCRLNLNKEFNNEMY